MQLGKKLLSLFGSSLIWFSMFTMWWSIVSYLLTAPAIIVLFYYFIKEQNRLKRLLIGALLAMAGAHYIVSLYPAWQVPMGWIMVSLMAWVLAEDTSWMKYKLVDWAIFAADVLFMVSIVARYLYVDQEYLTAIMNTVYPGSRVSYGGYALDKLLGYYASYITPLGGYPNPCEMSVIFGVFPLGFALMAYVQYKCKFRNKLLWFLFVPTMILFCYASFELPQIVAKLLMLTYSIPVRVADYLGVALAYILIVCISEIIDQDGMPYYLSFAICGLCSIPAIMNTWANNAGLKMYLLAVVVVLSLIMEGIIVAGKKNSKIWTVTMAIGAFCFAVDGLSVNPVTVGLDALTSKPVYAEIRQIVEKEPESRWAALDNIATGNYLLSAGAPTINSVNFIPNMDLWKKLDPKGEHEEVYNRYAHFILSLSETGETDYNLIQADLMQITVNEKDFDLMDLDYIYSNEPVKGIWKDKMELLYDHNGSMIYKVIK